MSNPKEQYEIGMVGLGVMGRNLLLNMADHGFSVAGYDKDSAKVEALKRESEQRDIRGAVDIDKFIKLLRRPRAVMMLVPAGAPVDAVIHDLLPHLAPGDLIIDGGNSYFKDTNLRAKALARRKVGFLGVGVSGGEEGARHGPSIMPGGPEQSYERVRAVFEAAAAKVNGEPCVAWLGPGSAGHFVKMVHNGIEYGVMELIAETYDLMKRGLGLSDDELHDVYAAWNNGDLNSFLVEITSQIFQTVDKQTGQRLIDKILDVAKQLGTGMWTSQSAMELGVPIPTIDVAVAMRNLSALEDERRQARSTFKPPSQRFQRERENFLDQLRGALYAGMLITYAQGMAVLEAASEAYKYQLNLETVARIWRGGCIIRAALLEEIRAAYRAQPGLRNLLLDEALSKRLIPHEKALRRVVSTAAELSLPAIGFMTALGYFDGYRRVWLPTNLIQAQRDYFGAHTYERIDAKGIFHTEWEGTEPD
jgi:6-phosphogluconate dehydrogenase